MSNDNLFYYGTLKNKQTKQTCGVDRDTLTGGNWTYMCHFFNRHKHMLFLEDVRPFVAFDVREVI